jgi:tetratricopeptide (TPR) repeat protein
MPTTSSSSSQPAARGTWVAIGLLGAATLAAYANSLHGPFVYDDIPSIVDNSSIRAPLRFGEVLLPSLDGAVTTAGRPVLNLSFALSHAISGTDPWGYHALNLVIHLGAALTLFGLVRRTLLLPALAPRFGAHAALLAFTTAAWWALHPVQTQAVTYTVQRAESLMGFFYLFTLYAFVRAMESTRSPRWLALSVAACALGMATKEVMVTAPIIVLLFDRAFVAGTLSRAWQTRRRYYIGLAATWALLGALVLSTGGNRGGSIGLGVGVSWAGYVLTQFEAVTCYLALSAWPHPLVFEYGTFWVRHASEVALAAAVVLPLLAATLTALRRNHPLGFAGAWFFGILAPTSLSPGTTQMIVEHRVYLPLAALLLLGVLGVQALVRSRATIAGLVAVLACATLTAARNHDYRSAIALWSDTLAKRPDQNLRAHENLAGALLAAGRVAEGLAHYETAVQLAPDSAKAHYNVARALLQSGRARDAAGHFAEAVRLAPEDANAHTNLALALAAGGDLNSAIPHAALAARLAPARAEIRFNHALILQQSGRTGAAVAEYEAALRVRPDYVEAHNNLGNALRQLGRLPEAIAQYDAALRLDAGSTLARDNLTGTLLAQGRALAQAGHPRDALVFYERALQLDPRAPMAHYNLANALLALDDLPGAITRYEEAVRLRPDFVDAHMNLGTALRRAGRPADPIGHFEQAVRLAPDDVGARLELGNTLVQSGRPREAIEHYEQALRLRPDLAAVREQIARLRAATSPATP